MDKPDTIFINSLKENTKDLINNVSDLLWDKKMYNEFCDIIKSNPSINKPNAFHDFIKLGYSSHVVLGVCRQVDKDKSALSLINLMEKIFDNPQKITKDWFVDQYKAPLDEAFGKRDFEDNFGKLDFVDPSIIYADIGSLIFYTKEIKKFRDKRIAHLDKNKKLIFNINFNDINIAIKIIEKLSIKYYLLLHQGGYTTLTPEYQGPDYKEIFYYPWINKNLHE